QEHSGAQSEATESNVCCGIVGDAWDIADATAIKLAHFDYYFRTILQIKGALFNDSFPIIIGIGHHSPFEMSLLTSPSTPPFSVTFELNEKEKSIILLE